MRNSDVVKVYLDEVSRELIGSKRRKKEILNQLSIDIEDYAENCSDELSLEVLEQRFGAPRAAASSLLMETQVSVVQRQVKKRKAVISITAVCCVVVFLLVACYILFDNWRKEDFANGYEAVTEVINEQDIPEHIKNPPSNTRNYYGDSGG